MVEELSSHSHHFYLCGFRTPIDLYFWYELWHDLAIRNITVSCRTVVYCNVYIYFLVLLYMSFTILGWTFRGDMFWWFTHKIYGRWISIQCWTFSLSYYFHRHHPHLFFSFLFFFPFFPANIFDMKNIGVETLTLEEWCRPHAWFISCFTNGEFSGSVQNNFLHIILMRYCVLLLVPYITLFYFYPAT